MTIDELKKEIKQLSDENGIMLRLMKLDEYICVQRQYGLWQEIAFVGLDENFIIDTYNDLFETQEEEIKEKLFNILIEFAKTPIDEREEEKKYQYKLKGKYWWILKDFEVDKIYLNFIVSEYCKNPLLLNDCEDLPSDKTIFTDKEIKEVAEKFDVDLEMFDKIEVAND